MNSAKVRVARSTGRMEVTGIVVNEKPNLPRAFVREIRSMLYAWERYGLVSAGRHFSESIDTKDRRELDEDRLVDFSAVVRGKLDYLRMVRGVDDDVYAKLVGWYADLEGTYVPPIRGSESPIPLGVRRVIEALWFLESLEEEADTSAMSQGTGFMLRGFGLVTCAHVITPNHTMRAFRSDEPRMQYVVVVRRIDAGRDLAILGFESFERLGRIPLGCCDVDAMLPRDRAPSGAHLRLTHEMPTPGQSLHLLGFPNYSPGHTAHIREARVTGQRTHFGFPRISVDGSIVTGMSGGPAVDNAGRVIGVLATGAESEIISTGADNYGIIPAPVLRTWRTEIGQSSAPFETLPEQISRRPKD
ncbi:MAG TPA: trypsin-like peptidase domain-containing protein [Gemmatimonadaceae bacterium]|nr:trypsin-like peptidase domain-containing protein [Gemmatimonadaceae bacterium]